MDKASIAQHLIYIIGMNEEMRFFENIWNVYYWALSQVTKQFQDTNFDLNNTK